MLMRFGTLLLAAMSGLAIGLVSYNAPAFKTSLRVTGPSGDWRISPGSLHYNSTRYTAAMARIFLDAAPIQIDGNLIEDPYLAVERAKTMATKAETLLLESLRLSPSDARVWADLAWARLLREDIVGAQAALELSWKLAPRDLDLAIRRLDAISVLQGAYSATVKADFGVDQAAQDMRTIVRHRPAILDTYIEVSPFLAELALSRGIAPPA